jgi:hypothetical protein
MNAEAQRMLWLAAGEFGDDGKSFKGQERRSALKSWALGIEKENGTSFASLYDKWCG